MSGIIGTILIIISGTLFGYLSWQRNSLSDADLLIASIITCAFLLTGVILVVGSRIEDALKKE